MSGALKITLPSGAVFPDWESITSPTARAALDAVFALERVERRWNGLDHQGEALRNAILEGYRQTGHAPSLAELGACSGLDGERLRSALADLARRDIIIIGSDGGIAGAYPFVEQARGHRLRLAGVEINAMCAIDALGAGAMCGADAVIDSACARCGAPIHIETRHGGASLAMVTPAAAVVRVGMAYEDGCAAHSLCREMSYFCSDDHLDGWCADNGATDGYRLSMDEGLQVGKAIFKPMLAAGSDNN